MPLPPLAAAAPPAAARGPTDPARPASIPAQAAAPAPPRANPALRIDPALNIVVLEFRGADGAVRHSLPTARELDAYRQGGASETAPMRVTAA